VFDKGQEMLGFVTELTLSRYDTRYISRYGCTNTLNTTKTYLCMIALMK